jgi:hypothetical protein
VSTEAATPSLPRTLWRDDLVAALTGGLLILGLFLDGWNHLNLQNGKAGEFLTPWHGLLYAGFNACAIWAITRNTRLRAMMFKGRSGKGGAASARTAPQLNGRHVMLAGLALAGAGVIGDAVARSAGVVADSGTMQPPFDFLLFTGAGLIFAMALRSAAGQVENFGKRVAFPVVLSAGAAAAAVIAFGGQTATKSVDSAVRTITNQPSVSQTAPRTFPATHHARSAAASSHAGRTVVVHHRAAAVHSGARSHASSSSVAASPAAVQTHSSSSSHASRTVVVHRRAARHVTVAPRRSASAPAAPKRRATHSKGRFQQVAVPELPSDSSSVTTSSGSSGSSAPAASSPSPAASPTAAPTPTTSNPPANNPPATPPTAKHGGPGPG